MLELDKLKQEREQAYDVWFERWWAREDVEHQIKIANYQGYTRVVINFRGYSLYDTNRLKDSRFSQKLTDKLPGFDIGYSGTTWDVKDQVYKYGIGISW